MRILAKLATLVAVVGVLSAGHANAQGLDPATQAALNTALANGDALSVQLVVASVQGDTAATQAVAAQVLAAAQSIKAADPAGAGVLAAIALASGGLQGNAGATAANIVNVSGSPVAATLIALSNSGAPPPVIATILVGVITNPISNPSQSVASNNNSGSVQ